RDAGVGFFQHAGTRHVLRRRSFSLRAHRRGGLPALWRSLLLVSQMDRAPPERTPGPLALLALFYRIQSDVLPNAYPRLAWNDAAHLYVCRGKRLGQFEPSRNNWRGGYGTECGDIPRQSG